MQLGLLLGRPAAESPHWIATLAAGLGGTTAVTALWLLVHYPKTRGTTLRAPLVWAVIAWAAILLTAWMTLWGTPSSGKQTLRYLAACTSLCPAMALFGAKRPQDQGWQFVVATLWIVLAIPAAQRWAFSPRSGFELHPAWCWFLLLLIGVSVTNYLPTRYALGAVLAGVAQLLLFRDSMSGLSRSASPVAAAVNPTLALVLFFLAIGWVAYQNRSTRPTAGGWNRVWLDFRDQFGAVWALRVMERINHAARQAGRGEVLHWQGFVGPPLRPGETAGERDPLETTVRMLLRRFVSPEWIADRIQSAERP